MKKRNLGTLKVSELGLGCMGMSQSYGEQNDAELIDTIHRAFDLGIDFFDTAEIYGPFINETFLGKALKKLRGKVIIATKFGFNIKDGKMIGVNSQPNHIRHVVDESLQRLNTDYIDLFYQHRLDPNVPIEDVIGILKDLIQEGKIRHIGLYEVGVDTILRAHKIHPITALQSEYSLWERNLEAEIIPLLQKLNIGLVPFSPLGRGFLTGNVKRAEEYPDNDFRRNDPRFQRRNYDINMKIVATIGLLAEKKNATPAQIALSWLLNKGDHIVPIPGTKKRTYLEENVKACELELTNEDMKLLELTFPAGVASGKRYILQNQTYIN